MGTGSKAGGDTHEAPWGHSWPAKLQGLIGEGRQGGWWGEGGREGGREGWRGGGRREGGRESSIDMYNNDGGQ
jgi:hypothetical protein